MKSVVIYDSVHGNTAKVAKAIYESVSKYGKANLVLAAQFKPSDISSADVVFIGTPTQGGRPTPVVQSLLKQLSPKALRGVYIAPFDTRFSMGAHGAGLKFVMKTFGFASPKITKALRKLHAGTVMEGQGFIVKDTEGPLDRDELNRASLWARTVVAQAKHA